MAQRVTNYAQPFADIIARIPGLESASAPPYTSNGTVELGGEYELSMAHLRALIAVGDENNLDITVGGSEDGAYLIVKKVF